MTDIQGRINPAPNRNSTTIGDNNRNCNNVTASYNTYNGCQLSVPDERGQVQEWLSPLAPRERHLVISVDRVDGVGDWFLRTDAFVRWHTSETQPVNPVLFCCGDPGTGKTYLSSLVIDALCEGDVVVACMYCDFHAPEEQPATGLLAALLKQVVAGLEPIPGEIQSAFKRAKRQAGGRAPHPSEIPAMLIKSISSLQRVFICIDALDEFPQKHRCRLWQSLQYIVRECPNARLFVTGRLHIGEEVRRYFTGRVATVPVIPRQEDIKSYLRSRLEMDHYPEAMDNELRVEILITIPERISDTFLLVSLVMDEVLDQTTRSKRMQILRDMTKGLNLQGVYTATLERIEAQKGDQAKLGMRALVWISRSHRPLQAEELCHALAVEEGTADFDIYNVPTRRILLACTLGLVKIDQQTSTVRLMHFTLREYLEEHHNLLTSAHSTIAQTCLTYLNTPSIQKLTAVPDDTRLAKPFLEYASCYWGVHARSETTENVKPLALQLLEQYPDHISAKILLRQTLPEPLAGFTGLHCIAFLGIEEIATAMVDQKKWDLNGRDSTGATPLMWAARYRNYNVAKSLLDQGDVDPNSLDNDGLTPLLWAARSGEGALVRLLVEQKNVNPNSPDGNGRTPLSFAAEEGHEGVVELLLGRMDIDPDSPDHNGRTPLSFAACSRNESVVKVLLKRADVSPSLPNNNGRTPLSFAAWAGDEGSVRLLLELDNIDPNASDDYGQTPLLWASRSGQEGTMRLLLNREDVTPDTPNDDGQTPLLWAARSGHEGAVKMLLEQEGVNPDLSGKNGRTPLSFAARSGNEGVVRLLLDRDGVNLDSSDNDGRTPLFQAAMRGHEGVVKLLLKRGDVNPNSFDKDGQTPVSFATTRGHEGIARLLTQTTQLNHRLSQGRVQAQ